MSESASHPLPLHSSEQDATPGGRKEVRWEVVAQTPGLTPATIIAGRLHAEGIPVRAWQEGAGQALGLTVGLLGTGYVAVPEAFAAQALALLAGSDDDEALPGWDDEDEWDDDIFKGEYNG